jgi:hypothetical protein
LSLGFTAYYFARIIQAKVWSNTPDEMLLMLVFPTFVFSLRLLIQVVRDYQKFVHGLPGPALSPGQREALAHAIFEGDHFGAVDLYGRFVPDIGREAARDFVSDLTAKLKKNEADKFPRNLVLNLNWRAMQIVLIFELTSLAALSRLPATVFHGLSWFSCVALLIGFSMAGVLFICSRLVITWQRIAGIVLSFFAMGYTGMKYSNDGFFAAGIGYVAVMMAIGLRRKKRKFVS